MRTFLILFICHLICIICCLVTSAGSSLVSSSARVIPLILEHLHRTKKVQALCYLVNRTEGLEMIRQHLLFLWSVSILL